jgi:hypothetical protein
MKPRIFMWLAVKNKSFTWEPLHRRNRQGPSKCSLCKVQVETKNHLLIFRDYTTYVSKELESMFGVEEGWKGETIEACLKNWFSKPKLKSFKALPITTTCSVAREVMGGQRAHSDNSGGHSM